MSTDIWGSVFPGSAGGGGGGPTPETVVQLGSFTNYSALTTAYPADSSNLNHIAYVENSTGVYLINRKNKGWYISDGSSWTPYEFDDLAFDALAQHLLDYNHASIALKQQQIQNVINVNKTPGPNDYSTIGAALAAVTGNTSSNPWMINVGPGVFVEDTLVMKPYVYVRGSGNLTTVIQVDTATKTVVTGAASCMLENVEITGATSGIGISCSNLASANPFLVHNVAFGNNQKQVSVSTTAALSIVQIKNCTSGGFFDFTTGFECSSTNAAQPAVMVIDGMSFLDVVPPSFPVTLVRSTGVGAQVAVSNMLARSGSGTGTAFSVEDGSQLRLISSTVRGFQYGIRSISSGAGVSLRITGTNIESSYRDVSIENSGTTGYLSGYVPYSNIYIDQSSSFFITNKDTHIVTVAKRGGDFASIAAAMDSITDATDENQYIILVGPGVFNEPLITTKEFVSVVGYSILATIIEPDDVDHHVFEIPEPNTELSFMTIRGAGPGYAGVFVDDCGDFAQMHKVSMLNNDTHIYVRSQTKDTYLYMEYVDINGSYENGVITESNGFVSQVNLENWYTFNDSGNSGYDHFATGPDAVISAELFSLNGSGLNTGFQLENGAVLRMAAGKISDADVAVHMPNIGAGTHLEAVGIQTIGSVTNNYKIQHPDAEGFVSGSLDLSVLDVVSSANVKFNVVDNQVGSTKGQILVGELWQGENINDLENISSVIRAGATSGILGFGPFVFPGGSALTIDILAGSGFVRAMDGSLKTISWNAQDDLAIPDNSTFYITINSDSVLQFESSVTSDVRIVLGTVTTLDGEIIQISDTSMSALYPDNTNQDMLRRVFGAQYVSGNLVSENLTTPRAIDITPGEYFYGSVQILNMGGTEVEFTPIYRDGVGGWVVDSAVSVVPNDSLDDDSGTLATVPTGEYTKHILISSGSDTTEKWQLVIGQNSYASSTEAANAELPDLPPFVEGAVVKVAAIIMQEGLDSIFDVISLRPFPVSAAASQSAVTDHGALTGLSDNDHPQYLLRSGANKMTGALDLDGNAILNPGTIPGLTTAAPVSITPDQSNTEGVSSHKARADHIHNIPTGTPVTISTNNSAGVAASFAKSDHIHAHGNLGGGSTHAAATTSVNGYMSAADKTKLDIVSDTELGYVSGITSSIQTQLNGKQALNSTLTTLSSYNTNGIFTQTASGTFTGRTITPGSGKVQVTNGNGVSGNPTIDVDESALTITNLGGTLTVAKGGTGSGTSLTNGKVMQSSAGTIIESSVAINDLAHVSEIDAVADGELLKMDAGQVVAAAAGTDYLVPNGLIVSGTATKITYDSNGLVTAGTSATTADFADSSNKRFVTDAQLTQISNLPNISGDAGGNAATATALQTPRTINGTSFNGTANITVTAAAGTLTGTTLNSSVVTSSLTSVGTLTNLTVTNPIAGSLNGNASTATALQNARTINGTSFDGTANITVAAAANTLTGTSLNATVVSSSLTSVGTLGSLTVTAPISGSVTGNAGTATALQNARTINGTSFDGTANITVTAAAGTLTGTTLNSSVVTSSLTAVGTLTNLTVTNTIVGSINGNAATATALQTARNINGVSFNGTANITVTADANTLTNTTLNATVVNSSLVSVGTLTTGVWNASIIPGQYGGTGVANTGKTITVSGNTVIGSNTDTVTFGTTAATSVTLPPGGVLQSTQPRIQSVTSSATVTPNADTNDAVVITAQAAALTLANPTGTPNQMQKLIIRVKDNGTARAIAYGAQYRGIGNTLPSTTVISKTLYMLFVWNATDSRWDLLAVAQEP